MNDGLGGSESPPHFKIASHHHSWGRATFLGLGSRGCGNQAWPPEAVETSTGLEVGVWGQGSGTVSTC